VFKKKKSRILPEQATSEETATEVLLDKNGRYRV